MLFLKHGTHHVPCLKLWPNMVYGLCGYAHRYFGILIFEISTPLFELKHITCSLMFMAFLQSNCWVFNMFHTGKSWPLRSPTFQAPTFLARQIHDVRRLAGANIQGGLFALAPAPTTVTAPAVFWLEEKRSCRTGIKWTWWWLSLILSSLLSTSTISMMFLSLSFLTNKWCASFWSKTWEKKHQPNLWISPEMDQQISCRLNHQKC